MSDTTTDPGGCPHCDNRDPEKLLSVAPPEPDLGGPWVYMCEGCGAYSFYVREGDSDREAPVQVYSAVLMSQVRDLAREQSYSLERIADSLERRELDDQEPRKSRLLAALDVAFYGMVVFWIVGAVARLLKVVL